MTTAIVVRDGGDVIAPEHRGDVRLSKKSPCGMSTRRLPRAATNVQRPVEPAVDMQRLDKSTWRRVESSLGRGAARVAAVIRALRGATQLAADDPAEMSDAVVELLSTMLDRNGLTTDDLVSVIFTSTPDLRSTFPAAAARVLEIGDVPLICAQELDVDGALPRVVRVMAHAMLDRPRREVAHVYLRGAEVLRQDLAQ